MKKGRLTFSDMFSVLAVCGLWFYYRSEIVQKADGIFLSLFGKNLTGRNHLLQIAVLGGVFLCCVLFPLLLERLIRQNPKFTRLADGIILTILAIPAVQLLIICANQVLRRDDYWEIADARTYGFPGSMFYEIRRWNGRYTGWGLRSLHAVLPNIPYIDIFLFITLALLTVGNTLLAYRFLNHQTPGSPVSSRQIQSFLTGFGLTIAFVLMSSNIWEFWFWGSGTMIYGFGIAMCVLSAALVLNAADHPSHRKMILPIMTCFLTCGCSELCTASLAAFLFIILVWKRVREKRWNRQILFFFAEICMIIVGILLISGSLDYAENWSGTENSEDGNAVSKLIAWLPGMIGWAFSGLHGYTFIKSRELLLFLGTAFLIGTQLQFEGKGYIRYLVIALLLTVIAHCVLMINSLLNYMPPRVITVGICWFVASMSLGCALLGSLLTRGNPRWNGQIKMIFCALLLALAMNRFYSENISEARQIRESWYIRNALLNQYAGNDEALKTCSLPSPGSFREDILEDPEDEFNKAAARFYQIPSISADHRCPPWGESFVTEDKYK